MILVQPSMHITLPPDLRLTITMFTILYSKYGNYLKKKKKRKHIQWRNTVYTAINLPVRK